MTASWWSCVTMQSGWDSLETLLPNGTPNPIAQLVLGILAQFNSMERSLIRSRMESGYWYAGTAIPEGYIYAGNAGGEREIIELGGLYLQGYRNCLKHKGFSGACIKNKRDKSN